MKPGLTTYSLEPVHTWVPSSIQFLSCVVLIEISCSRAQPAHSGREPILNHWLVTVEIAYGFNQLLLRPLDGFRANEGHGLPIHARKGQDGIKIFEQLIIFELFGMMFWISKFC